MTTASLTDADLRIRNAVVRQLDWDPEVDAGAIGVAARDSVITLSGYVPDYPGRLAAERAAKRVRGVRGVANDIEVRRTFERNDSDIARDATRALELRTAVPPAVQLVVRSGRVTLTGKVSWLFQKTAAEHVVRHVRGVLGVLNQIEITPSSVERDVRHRIMDALHRNADIDARHVVVTVDGNVARLTGRVGSWLQHELAERAAGSAPGITHVDNQIVVMPPDESAGGLLEPTG